MSRRIWIECTFEMELYDLPDQTAQSVENSCEYAAQLSAASDRVRAAVETVPGVTLHMWGEMISPADPAA